MFLTKLKQKYKKIELLKNFCKNQVGFLQSQKLKKDLKKAQKLNKEILNSTSWKLTGVFRKPKTVLKKFRD